MTKKQKPFSINSVKIILTNITYTGKIHWGKLNNWDKKDINGNRKRNYNEESILVEGVHEAIIDTEVFDKVQELIQKNPRSHVKQFSGNHILSGLLRCPVCGYGMSVQRMCRRGKEYWYYGCNQYMNNHSRCKPNMIPKDKVEAEFYKLFKDMVSQEEFTREMKEVLGSISTRVGEVEDSIRNYDKQKRKIEGQVSNLIESLSLIDGEGREAVAKRIQEKTTEKKEIINKIVKLEEQKRKVEEETIDVEGVIEVLSKADKVFPLLDKEVDQCQ